MADCPKCGHLIDNEFGMFNCPSCQVFLSVDLDGNISLAEEVDLGAGIISDQPSEFTSDSSIEADPLNNKSYEPSSAVDFEDASKQEMDVERMAGIEQDAVVANEGEADIPYVEEDLSARPAKSLDTPDLSDVVSFGNSELSSSQVGGILYDIYLSGIDTAEIREEIRLHLGDRKFLWNVDDLMKSIKNGRLVIQQINAVKAAIFIQRIRHLDIEIQWKQNEIVKL